MQILICFSHPSPHTEKNVPARLLAPMSLSKGSSPILDEMDVKILRILQQDCTRAVADIGKEVGLSTTPCWRRIQKLEEAGVIKRRVAGLDPPRVNSGVTHFLPNQIAQPS